MNKETVKPARKLRKYDRIMFGGEPCDVRGVVVTDRGVTLDCQGICLRVAADRPIAIISRGAVS